LIADVDVPCDSDAYDHVVSAAWTAITIYSFGTIALEGALLFAARDAILRQQPSKLSHAVRFLHNDYTLRCWWWEVRDRR
jgi:hypothetical protein